MGSILRMQRIEGSGGSNWLILAFSKLLKFCLIKFIIKFMEPSQNQKNKLDEFILLRKLGTGTQADVMLGEYNQQSYAIKIYNTLAGAHEIQRQSMFLKKLKHHNIVRLIDVREDAILMNQGVETRCSALVLEYVRGMQLLEILKKMERFPESIARGYFKVLLNALAHMHEVGIAHFDFKVDNILIDLEFEIKIIDFGCSVSFESQRTAVRKSFSSLYWPPQIYEGVHDQKQVDLFALGIIVFMVVVGKFPFNSTRKEDPNYETFCSKKTNPSFWAHYQKQASFSQEFINLVNKMLHPDPKERLSLKELSKHPWLEGESLNPQQIKSYFETRLKQKVS